MKLAEVASGGQQWTFENLPEEPSTPCDEVDEMEAAAAVNSEATAGDNYKNGDNSILDDVDDESEDMQCNGHEIDSKNGATPLIADTASADLSEVAANEVNNGQSPSANSATARPPILCSSTSENKVDPVTEIAPDLSVKIADLGNACWVVSTLYRPVCNKIALKLI